MIVYIYIHRSFHSETTMDILEYNCSHKPSIMPRFTRLVSRSNPLSTHRICKTYKILCAFSRDIPRIQRYRVFLDLRVTTTTLDALHKIQYEQDLSIDVPSGCTDGTCGACALSIDGINRLSCLHPIQDTGQTTTIYPILKDNGVNYLASKCKSHV